MGDLASDTAVRSLEEGRYEATLSADWEIWGPMGGYVAACALRAAGAATEHPRPATFSCHYLGVARFGAVDLRVETRRRGRAATAQRVEVTEPPFIAPTLDLNVAFHRPATGREWLLCDGEAPVSTDGLFGWTARVWSTGGLLHASGGGQCMYRRLPPPG